jgi:S-DNA-T family DNA segregation ATPase FtsK/SpoIIIE
VRYQLGGVDGISAREAVESARALVAGLPADPSPPPRVELAELLALGDDLERGLLESWIRDRSGATPRLPRLTFGLGPGQIRVAADLRSDEHLLIGGSAGAGKSELLRSLATALAVQCSPRRLRLAMVGPEAALGSCGGLPHVVSRVTDLRGDAGRELLAWLGEELARRVTVLTTAGTGDMAELELAQPDQAPARLLVLVDEVRELLASTPDAGPALVEAAHEGGRLGVHLLLATGHAREVVAALGDLPGPRVALRCADTGDSEVLVGTADAARTDLPPGRGFLCTGPGRVVEFQVAAASGAPLSHVVEATARLSARLGLESHAPQ